MMSDDESGWDGEREGRERRGRGGRGGGGEKGIYLQTPDQPPTRQLVQTRSKPRFGFGGTCRNSLNTGSKAERQRDGEAERDRDGETETETYTKVCKT